MAHHGGLATIWQPRSRRLSPPLRGRKSKGEGQPRTELFGFFADLRIRGGLGTRCLEFVILTACRTVEAIGATCTEIDEEARLWGIPGVP
jgi:hypothetical protein